MRGKEARKHSMAFILTTALLSMGATNCRFFGNYQESGNSSDPYSGFYEMAPQAASLWVVHANRGTLTQAVSFQQIPMDGVNATFSNPVAFLAEDTAKGVGRIVSLADTSFYQFFRWTPETGAIDVSGPTSPTTAWDMSACTYQTWFTLVGNLQPGNGPFTSGSTRRLSGRITLNVEATTRFEGADCPQFLDTLQSCYSDVSRCGPSSATAEELKRRQAIATQLYAPFVRSGVIQATDIARSTSLSYRIEYR